LAQRGKVSWDGLAEFGDLLAGNVLVPDASKSIIVFRDSQGGYGDLALAAWTYEEARRKGLGQEISTE
jgi:ornithine cyclodeaminase/alanine dehydrogenase-like protein (mu-crystallin family)